MNETKYCKFIRDTSYRIENESGFKSACRSWITHNPSSKIRVHLARYVDGAFDIHTQVARLGLIAYLMSLGFVNGVYGNIGATLRACSRDDATIDLRFERLLSCRDESQVIKFILGQSSYIKSKVSGIDFVLLLQDIESIKDVKVKSKWAYGYAGGVHDE